MKFEEKTYYKLCHHSQISGNSYSYSTPCDNFRLQYNLRKITRPIPGTIGIFVFDTLKNVYTYGKAFDDNRSFVKIFECRVKGPVLHTQLVQSIISCEQYWIHPKKTSRSERLVALRKQSIHGFMVRRAPLGTYSVAAVQLIKDITESSIKS